MLKAPATHLEKLQGADIKKIKDYDKVVSKIIKLKDTDLRAKGKIETIVKTEIYPHMWSFQVKVLSLHPYTYRGKEHGVRLTCYSTDPLIESQFRFYTLSKLLPEKLEIHQTIWITGYFGETARSFAGAIRKRSNMVGKKMVSYKQIRNSADTLVSPEFIDKAPAEVLKKLHLEGK